VSGAVVSSVRHRRALTTVTATMTADTTIVTDQTTATAAGASPPRLASERGTARSAVFVAAVATGGDRADAGVLATRRASDGTVEGLLRRRAGLPAGHPGRAVLRVRGIEAGLPLARWLAARYQGRGEPLDDLYQVAAVALVKAVDGYNPAREVAFTSYAVPTIVGALKRHLRDTAWRVRVPRRVQELAVGLGATSARLAQQLGRSPSLAELAGYLDAAEDDVAIAWNAWRFRRLESLDALVPTGASERRPVMDAVGVVDARFDAVTDWHVLRPLLAALPVRERRVVAMRYFGDLTQAEIAVQVGLSQMHVSRLLVRALAQLRAGMLAEPSRATRRTPVPPAVLRG
jgi:RNA polymerase sigma-B factor